VSRSLLFLHSSSDLYGADRSLLRTISALTDDDTQVIVCLPYNGPLVGAIEDIGGEVILMNLAIMRRKYFTPIGIVGFLLAFLFAVARLSVICARYKVDIIHSNTTAILVGGVVARLFGKVHLWHVREIIIQPNIVRKVVAWFVYRLSTKVLCVSKATATHLTSDQPGIPNKVIVINNGIDPELYTSGDRQGIRSMHQIHDTEILVGMIARVSAWKGQDLFLEIAKEVCSKSERVHFMAIGSPFQGQESLMTDFENAVEDAGIDDKFTIVPFTAKVTDYLHAFDVFVLPSTLPDPFPTTVLEAMAASRAVVINGQGGAVDMVESMKSGIVIKEVNSSESFAKVITELIQDDQKRHNLGIEANRYLKEHFTENIYRANISSIFDQFTKGSSKDFA
jgi:glycosyltransferase involved in cell wall biosynthesis